MDTDIFDMLFNIFESIITVMKSVTFLGVPIFYISIAFLILSIVITYLVNTAKAPRLSSSKRDNKSPSNK